MARTRTKKVISICLITIMLLTGCGMNWQGTYSQHTYTDEDTGVEYIVFMAGVNNNGVSITVTPRLNADGSLYVSK